MNNQINYIKFQNKDYPTRDINLPEDIFPGYGIITIATTDLSNQLLKNGEEYVSKEAESIDETIYFFVEPTEIELEEDILLSILIRETT